jgi:hypothetical protein
MPIYSILLLAFLAGNPISPWLQSAQSELETSAYFAFVDRDYIFTVEVVDPGVLLFNFVSMTSEEKSAAAKQIRVRLANRTVIPNFFLIDTGDPKQPISAPSVNMRPRSSFGARIRGDFGDARELNGVSIRVGEEEFKLQALGSIAFENLVIKVNRINLGSPNFREDWEVLKLELLGRRDPASRK